MSSKWKTEDLGRCRQGSDMLRLRSLGSVATSSCWSVKVWLFITEVEEEDDSAYMASCAGAQSVMGKTRRGVVVAIAADSECMEEW